MGKGQVSAFPSPCPTLPVLSQKEKFSFEISSQTPQFQLTPAPGGLETPSPAAAGDGPVYQITCTPECAQLSGMGPRARDVGSG